MRRLLTRLKSNSQLDPLHILSRDHALVKKQVATNSLSPVAGVINRFNKRPAKVPIIAIALISGLFGTYFIYNSFAAVPTYYVDCTAGSDTANGTSSGSAWKSITKANSAPLEPGSQLLLKRGCTWTEVLYAKWTGTATNPIIIGAYGTGELPIISSNVHGREMVAITGSYQIFENISARGIAPKTDANCQNNPVGYIVGFSLKAGSSNNILRNVHATGNYAGISIKEGSHHNKVQSSQFINNTMMNPLDPVTVNADNDAGAFGVAIFGDDNEISGNTFSGQYACSYDYNGDGAAVEIYGGQRNHIHHNKSENNEAFTELGNIRSADNTFAYNQVTSSIATSSFLITRGGSDNRYGPINGTKAYNNTVYLIGGWSNGIICHGGCSATILSAKNNILWAGGKSLYADAPFDEGNNIYWRTGGNPVVQATISSSSQKVDPKFVDAANKNLHLQTGSPAIDRGVTLNYSYDLDNNSVPGGSAPDIGAYEIGTTTTTPPVTPTTITLKLINSDTDQVISTMTNGMTINLATARNLNIDASASGTIESMRFDDVVNNTVQPVVTENFPPYAIGGDAGTNSTDYFPWTPTVGNHTMTVKAFSADNSGGTELATTTINFTVTDTASTTSPTGWELLYEDNFSSLNTSVLDLNNKISYWQLYNGPGHSGNGLRRPEAFSIVTDPANSANKLLNIKASMNSSGQIVSGGMSNKTNIPYGRYEVRARTEADPTFTTSGVALTWPQSEVWPGDGELDWYETGTSRNPFSSFIHFPCNEYGGTCPSRYQTRFAHNEDASQWHTLVMEWTPESIKIFRDGQLVKTQDGTDAITDPRQIPDVPHHVSLQLDAMYTRTLTQPVNMYVDYVKVYKMSSTTVQTDTTAPMPPSSLAGTTTQPTSINPGKVALTWPAATDSGTNTSGIKGYYVYRNGAVISPLITATTYVDSNAPVGTQTYTVRSVDNVNLTSVTASPAYGTTIISPPDTTPPTTPANLNANPVSTTQINLSWTASTDAGGSGLKGYNLYRNGSTTPLNSSLITTTTYGDSTVQPGTSYSYVVEAIDGAGNKSAKSASVSATTPLALKPGDITGPTGSPDGQIDLSDISYVIRSYNTTDPKADLTGPTGAKDGKVDIYDLSFIIRNYGK